MPLQHFGRHVRQGARGAARVGNRHRAGGLVRRAQLQCDAEVEHLRPPVRRDHHVGGLEIAMDDTVGVRMFEGVGELMADAAHALGRHRASSQDRLQRLAADELHGDVRHAVHIAYFVDGADIGMIERGGGARLVQQPGTRGSVAICDLGQELECCLAPEPGIARAIHHAHAAGAS